MTISSSIPVPAAASSTPTPLVPSNAPAGSSGLSFSDALDAVNPLQHIPVASSIYRAVMGSQISPVSQVAGDTMYGVLMPGGAIAGLAASLANVAVKQVTGKDTGQLIVGAFSSSPSSSASSAASSAATPLVPASGAATAGKTTAQAINIPAVPLLRDRSTAQYARAQAFDSLNVKLLKMKA